LFQGSCEIILQCPNSIERTLKDGTISQEFCLNTDLKTRGRDKNHKSLPLVLQCPECYKKCYPHTTHQFQSIAEDHARKFLNAAFKDHQSLKSLSKEFYTSESRLSQYASSFKKRIVETGMQDILQQISDDDNRIITYPSFDVSFFQSLGIISSINNKTQLLGQNSDELLWRFEHDISGTIVLDSVFLAVFKSNIESGNIDYSKVMVIDETFLKIGGVHYYLIVAVSMEGELLSWALTRYRTADILNKVFLEALKRFPFPGIVITDHFGAYHKMIKQYPFPLIHVSHIHSRPHKRVIIYQRFIFPEKNEILELQIGMSTGVFSTSGQKHVYCLTKKEPIQLEKKKRGRKKGTKNRPKEIIEKEREEKKMQKDLKKNKKKKRGSRSIFKTGIISSTTHNIETNSFDFESPFNPEVHLMFSLLLYTIFLTFKGKHITSNYIENFFSQFKFFLNRGCRKEELKFLEDFQVYILSYIDRTEDLTCISKVIDYYLAGDPPPISFGYRNFFKSNDIPFFI